MKFLHGVQAGFDFRDIERGREQAAAQQTAAHAGAGAVENVEERRFLGFAGEQRLDQFEIANGGRVQDQGVGAIVEGGALQMIERGALGFAQVMKDRGGGAGGERAVFQAAAVERQEMEMIAEAARGVIGAEDPGLDVGLETRKLDCDAGGRQDFAGVQSFERGSELRRDRSRWRGIRRSKYRRARGRRGRRRAARRRDSCSHASGAPRRSSRCRA